jgi:hypothetical protein|tara:strand:- start:3273 stop:3413 length:141 start_codon:yes stop_codon:yes gene_type:complete
VRQRRLGLQQQCWLLEPRLRQLRSLLFRRKPFLISSSSSAPWSRFG